MSAELESKYEYKEHKEPELHFDIYYSSHEKAEDLSAAKQLFQKADIVVPEGLGWQATTEQNYNRLSRGEMSINDFAVALGYENEDEFKSADAFGYEHCSLVANTNKLVVFIDFPSEVELSDYFRPLYSLIRDQAETIDDSHDFDTFIRNLRELLENFGEINKEREEFMKEAIEIKLKRVIKSKPELSSKPYLSILISLGSVHTGISHYLQKSYKRTERHFDKVPSTFNFSDQATRAIIFGKEVDDLMVARSFIENYLNNHRNTLFSRFPSNARYKMNPQKSLASPFDLQDAEKLFNALKKEGETGFAREFLEILEAKGLVKYINQA